MERPEAPVGEERRGPSTAAWVGAVGLWVLMSIPNALRSGDENVAQTAGAFVGGLLSTLLIALLVRLIYARLIAKGRAVWSPWVFVIAAGLALLVNLGQVGNEAADREAGEPTAGQTATATSPEDLLVALPPGVRYEAISAAKRQEIERSLRAEVPNGDIEARSILSQQPPVNGLAIGLVGPGADDLEQFQRDFEGVGGTLQSEPINGTDFLVGPNRAGLYFAVRSPRENSLVMVAGASAYDVRTLARNFVGD